MNIKQFQKTIHLMTPIFIIILGVTFFFMMGAGYHGYGGYSPYGGSDMARNTYTYGVGYGMMGSWSYNNYRTMGYGNGMMGNYLGSYGMMYYT